MHNIRNLNGNKINSIELNASKQDPLLTMNYNIKGMGGVLVDFCTGASSSTITNGLIVDTNYYAI